MKHVARPVLDRQGGIANGSREPRRGPGHVESRTVPINGSAGALRVRRPARRTTKWPAGARGSIRVARQRLGARTARPAGAQAASGLISPPQAVHLDGRFTPRAGLANPLINVLRGTLRKNRSRRRKNTPSVGLGHHVATAPGRKKTVRTRVAHLTFPFFLNFET